MTETASVACQTVNAYRLEILFHEITTATTVRTIEIKIEIKQK